MTSSINVAPIADKSVKVAVVCRNASGEPDIVIYEIVCTASAYSDGDHYETAKSKAEEDGYEASIAFDEFDPAWRMLSLKAQGSTDVLMNQEGLQVIEQAFLKASKKDPKDAPFPLVGESATAYMDGLESAYQHALEMMCISPPHSEKSKAELQDRPRGG
jgi:hypothetical protein